MIKSDSLNVWIVATVVVIVAALAGLWWLAIPRHEICIAIYPAPAECGDHRVPSAGLWTAILTAVAVLGAVVVRWVQRPWIGPGVIAFAAVISVWAYRAVMFA